MKDKIRNLKKFLKEYFSIAIPILKDQILRFLGIKAEYAKIWRGRIMYLILCVLLGGIDIFMFHKSDVGTMWIIMAALWYLIYQLTDQVKENNEELIQVYRDMRDLYIKNDRVLRDFLENMEAHAKAQAEKK